MIFTWWESHRRDLPWRHTRDPYRILISEVMLQQTQVSRVIPIYEEFLSRFPTVFALAASSPADVLRLWKGMGYNRRALYLRRAAEVIVSTYDGQVPENEKLLSQLPGIGPYTAAAISVFAFEKDTVVIDTNINQIVTHYFFGDTAPKKEILQDVVRQLIPSGNSWEWYQALMDYGALALPLIPRKKPEKKQKKNTQSSLPFPETNRFFRGRIMDKLREQPYNRSDLITTFTQLYHRPASFFDSIIEKLTTEGMIIQTEKHLLQLPT